jgi:ABC-2 type transport system permease protein
MMAIIASQWPKLRRSGMLGALSAGVLVTTFGTVLTVVSAGSSGSSTGSGRGPASSGLTIVELTSYQGLGDALTRLATLLGVIALAVAAAVVAGEYSHGTLRNLLGWEPRRVRLAAGSWVALAIATAGAVAVASVIAGVGGVIAATQQGHSTEAWWTGSGVSDLATTIANLVLAAVGWTLFGALLAMAFRSPVTAVGVGVAYALPFETIIAGVSDDVGRWLPGQLLAALADGGNSTASYTAALLTLASYAVAGTSLALWPFQRHDVTI